MNNQFGLGEVLSSLKPELIRFQALLEEIPESYFETATPAAEIRNNENNEDINDIYETAQLITNTFSKLDLVERTPEWIEINKQAEQLKHKFEDIFPDLFDKK